MAPLALAHPADDRGLCRRRLPDAGPRRTKGPPVIRDAEIEQLLREYTQPILRVAGLAKQNVQVVIINDRSFNAFVADGRRIFINAGALMDAETPNQVIGVLAHETGHIAGGHLARMREQLRQPRRNRSSAFCSASARWSPRHEAAASAAAKPGWRPFRRRRP